MKENRLIRLSEFGTNVGELNRLNKRVITCLGNKLFILDSMEEITFEALKCIQETNSTNKDSESITKGVIEVLSHFGLGKPKIVTITNLNTNKSTKNKRAEPQILFNEYILGLETTPKSHLRILKQNVEDDLREITTLIKWYEGHEEIILFKEEGQTGRNHYQKMIVDFYQRSIAEQSKIIEHLLNGIKERAMVKAKPRSWYSGVLRVWEPFYDYPYEFGRSRPWSRTFDYRNIDRVQHRLLHVTVREIPEMTEMYKTAKEMFYFELFATRPVEEIFQSMKFYLAHVPMNQDRTHIFNELELLYNDGRWLAFTALGLLQVEGLFGDMIRSDEPDAGYAMKPLPQKVKYIKKLDDENLESFDYYQYVLNQDRNKLAHNGFVEDAKLKAHDILTDLDHILSMFYSIKTSLVELTILMRRRDQSYFSSYSGVGYFNSCLESVNAKHLKRKEVQNELNEFIQDFLIESCSIEQVAQEAEEDSQKILVKLGNLLDADPVIGDWKKLYKAIFEKEIKELEFKHRIEQFYSENQTELNLAEDIYQFFRFAKKYLTKHSDEVNKSLGAYDKTRPFIKWLVMVSHNLEQDKETLH